MILYTVLFAVKDLFFKHYMKQGASAKNANNFDLAIKNYRMAYLIQFGQADSRFADFLSDFSCELWSEDFIDEAQKIL